MVNYITQCANIKPCMYSQHIEYVCIPCRRPGFEPWVGKIPGEGKGYPLPYSGLENSTDCIVDGVAKSRRQLSDFHFTYILKVNTVQ